MNRNQINKKKIVIVKIIHLLLKKKPTLMDPLCEYIGPMK